MISPIKKSSFSGILYGRDQEQHQLVAAFHHAVSERPGVCLVEGPPGIGKSALLASMRHTVNRSGALCVSGLLAQQGSAPLLVQLLEDLFQQLLSWPLPRAHWRQRALEEAVGAHSALLVELVPVAARLFGPQPAVRSLLPEEERNRLLLLVRAVIGAVATPARPLVFFLDDCQWCDPVSAEMVRRLLMDPQLRHWCIVGAYRTEGSGQTRDPFVVALHAAQAAGAPVSRLALSPLTEADAGALIGAKLGVSHHELGPLPALIHERALGYPLYITQALDALVAGGALYRSVDDGVWHWSTAAVEQLPRSGATAALVQQRLEQLDGELAELLTLASYVGGTVSAEFLAGLTGQPVADVSERMARAVALGLLVQPDSLRDEELPDGAGVSGWAFAHDAVVEGLQGRMPGPAAQRLRCQIGEFILLALPKRYGADRQRLAAGYLNLRLASMAPGMTPPLYPALEPLVAIRRLALANQTAGQHALRGLEGEAALDFAQAGLAWLAVQGDPWLVDHDAALALSLLRLRATQFVGDHAGARQLAEAILPQVREPAMVGQLYQTLLMAATARDDFSAVDRLLGAGLLALGISFPPRPRRHHILWQFLRCRWQLRGISDQQLLAQSQSEDARLAAAARILISAFMAKQWQGQTDFVLLSALHGVQWTIQAGYTPLTVIGFALYTVALTRSGGSPAALRRFTQLTLAVLTRLPEHRARASVILLLNSLLLHRQNPLRDTVPPLRSTIEMSLVDGDGQFAADCALVYLTHLQISGAALPAVIAAGDDWIARLAICGDSNGLRLCRFLVANWRRLAESVDGDTALNGDEEALVARLEAARNRTGLFIVYSALLFRQLLAQDYAAAVQTAARARQYVDALTPGLVSEAIFQQIDSLAQLHQLSPQPRLRRLQLQRVAANQRSLQRWAELSPQNHRHRWLQVEAQRHSLLGRDEAAARDFNHAWELASREGLWPDAAGIAELAARHHLQRGEFAQAQTYLDCTGAAYLQWGAHAKLRILARTFPTLSPPETPGLHGAATAPAGADSLLAEALGAVNLSTTLPDTLQNAVDALLKLTGAQQVALLAGQTPEQAYLLAYGTAQQVNLWPAGEMPVVEDGLQRVPVPLLRYVLQARAPMLVDDIARHAFLLHDVAFRARGATTCWCLPVLIQGRVAGAVYLEEPAANGDRPALLDAVMALAVHTLLQWENERLHAQLMGSGAAGGPTAAPADLTVQLLGQCRVLHREVEIAAQLPERMQVLLAWLILQPGAASRSQLAQALWPDAPAAQGQTNLRNLLFKLRQVWPASAELLDFGRKEIAWQAGVVIDADVVTFQRAATVGIGAGGLSAQRALEQAAGLYQGDLLPKIENEALLTARERLHDQYLTVLDRLVTLHVEHAEFDPALRYARRLVQADPLRETGYQHLIRLYALMGDTASARRAYETCVDILHHEFGSPRSALTEMVFAQYVEA